VAVPEFSVWHKIEKSSADIENIILSILLSLITVIRTLLITQAKRNYVNTTHYRSVSLNLRVDCILNLIPNPHYECFVALQVVFTDVGDYAKIPRHENCRF